jgi:hypothetical protein
MSKARVFFITQNMMVGQNRKAVIFLRIQAADPRQTITDADLKPGLVQTVFKFVQDRIAKIGA